MIKAPYRRKEFNGMAYQCVLNHTEECNGCQECERQKKRNEERMRWDRYEEEYDHYRDAEYEDYLEREY